MAEASPHDRSSVVIADDDTSFALHLREWFTTRGYDAEIIEDPSALDARIRKAPPDLLVLDQQLGGVNPIELMRTFFFRYPSSTRWISSAHSSK